MRTHDDPRSRSLYPWVGVLAGLVLVVAAAWAADFIPGDVNDDGVFDIADPTVLRRELAGLGPGISQLCGNGVLDAGEECDSGVICSDLGFAFGELVCDAGCVAQVDTCTNTRFEDLGLTVFDHQTGLEWEKKTGAVGSIINCTVMNPCSDLHNVNNGYDWNRAVGEWLSLVNGVADGTAPASQVGLAGHTDWRIPTLAELLTIVDLTAPGCGRGAPCIDSTFGPTRVIYWSSSSADSFGSIALGVAFDSGTAFGSSKPQPSGSTTFLAFIRAVRSGPPICGDGRLNQASEECDSPNDSACPGECMSDCTCPAPPTCGDGVVNQVDEDCDAPDDSACPGSCEENCTCPVSVPPAPTGVVGCPSCFACDPWRISWSPSVGATHYQVRWRCSINLEQDFNVGNVTNVLDVCTDLEMCNGMCAFNVGYIRVEACNSFGCSLPVDILDGLPISCGGGCCV